MRADLRAKRPLLYQEVVNALYQIIDTSNLKPGDQMPAERELMEQLGVSRNVLREAFHILEQRGIITSQQGKGRFLREIPISQLGEEKPEEHNHRRIRTAPALCQKNRQRFYGTDAEHRIVNNSRNDAHNFS